MRGFFKKSNIDVNFLYLDVNLSHGVYNYKQILDKLTNEKDKKLHTKDIKMCQFSPSRSIFLSKYVKRFFRINFQNIAFLL